ncbi:MAG TPA: hypothetical protein VFH53_02030 [Phycisphaerae bacterium]|nr:hypothetical protein [Phycisphaerae bacterium]
MLAEEVVKVVTQVDLMNAVDKVGRLVMVVLAVQILMGLAWMVAHRRLAKNQIELAKLVRGECCQGGGD